jgi:hypothetical protein
MLFYIHLHIPFWTSFAFGSVPSIIYFVHIIWQKMNLADQWMYFIYLLLGLLNSLAVTATFYHLVVSCFFCNNHRLFLGVIILCFLNADFCSWPVLMSRTRVLSFRRCAYHVLKLCRDLRFCHHLSTFWYKARKRSQHVVRWQHPSGLHPSCCWLTCLRKCQCVHRGETRCTRWVLLRSVTLKEFH